MAYRDRLIICENRLKLLVFLKLVIRNDVVDIIERPSPVPYWDGAQQKHYACDFLVEVLGGRRLLIIIAAPGETSAARAVARVVDAQLERYDILNEAPAADEVQVITNEDITDADLNNIDTILRAVRCQIDEHDARIDRITAFMSGAIKIEHVIHISGLDHLDGFLAVVRLIAKGALSFYGGHLAPRGYVSRARLPGMTVKE